MIGVTILGATGSIGVSTLDVLSRHRDKYEVVALTANRNVEFLLRQCVAWQPKFAVVTDHEAAGHLQKLCRGKCLETEVLSGEEGLQEVVSLPEVDYVMAAIVGAAGLLPTMAAAKAGKRVLLANKESLVMSGHLLMEAVNQNNAELLPVDSEHNAIFQCIPPQSKQNLAEAGVVKILLTGSGGPFRTRSIESLGSVTPEQACAHPNWNMGRKISVDSATMMNKGLEMIEACWLFNVSPNNIQVVLHPQSVIHSMVQYVDGSVLAQLGVPDMRTPIAQVLAWPERMESGVESLDISAVAHLDFEPPDLDRFPCLRLANEAMVSGGDSTVVMNAANEVAVAEFLNGKIRFTEIAGVIEATLENVSNGKVASVEAILAVDSEARRFADTYARRLVSC